MVAKIRAGLVEAKLVKADKIISPIVEVEELKAKSIESEEITTGVLEADTIKANKIEGVEFEQVTNVTNVTNVEQTVVVNEGSATDAVARFIKQVSDSIQTAFLQVGDITATGKIISPVVEVETLKAQEGVFDRIAATVLGAFNKLTAVFVKADQVEAGKLTVDEVVVTDKTSGSGIVEAGESEVQITNSLITDSSRVFITFRDSYAPASRHWVSEIKDGEGFTVTLDEPVEFNARFDFWIINHTPSEDIEN